ncbi:MAG TPA: PaaI family thioesterase [Caulobacteraceae bacterium]
MNRTGHDIPPTAPPGFELQADRGPFTAHNGPLYIKRTDDGVEQAFFALRRHCNGLGLVHGGMISAFLDGLLAGAVGRSTRATPVTMHLSIDFLAMARAGEWLIGDARLSHAAREVAFAEGTLKVGDRPVARASGVFRLMRPRRA